MLWLYHDSSTLSTPPQGGPESLRPHLHNYLQINGKKCIFLCYKSMSIIAPFLLNSAGAKLLMEQSNSRIGPPIKFWAMPVKVDKIPAD